MALPTLITGATKKSGVQIFDSPDYHRSEDTYSNRFMTEHLMLKEVDPNTLGVFDKPAGTTIKRMSFRIAKSDSFIKILAASATYIRAGQSLSTGIPITFAIDKQPDVARNLSYAFVSHAQITAFTLQFVGTDAKGTTITEQFTEVQGWSNVTVQAFAYITSITLSARTGTGAGDTMNVGIGSLVGLSSNIAVVGDVFKVTKNVAAGNAADYSGTGNVTVNATYATVDLSTGTAIVAADNYTITYLSIGY